MLGVDAAVDCACAKFVCGPGELVSGLPHQVGFIQLPSLQKLFLTRHSNLNSELQF